jgi:hypothetical protein
VRGVDLRLMWLCIDRLKKVCKEKYNVANVHGEHCSSSCYTHMIFKEYLYPFSVED